MATLAQQAVSDKLSENPRASSPLEDEEKENVRKSQEKLPLVSEGVFIFMINPMKTHQPQNCTLRKRTTGWNP